MQAMAGKLTWATGAVADLAFARPDAPAPAEHLPSGRELRLYMAATVAAVVPALALGVALFGWRMLATAAAAFAAGRLVEISVARFRGKPTRGGALTVGVLTALVMPVEAPLWAAPLAAAFGVFFAREAFGGTGHNVFNPVLIGKAFLVVSFPTLVGGPSVDDVGETAARGLLGLDLAASHWAAVAIALAGLLLLCARAVDWRIPCATFVAGMGGVLTLRGLGLGELPPVPQFLLGGGFLLGALVLAGDPATAPGTRAARSFYGLLVGTAAVVICAFTANAAFMMFAVLLGNVAAPTLDAVVLASRAGRRST
jgi:Na+-translocating ferredoxin:NAD+ oxidoreductase RnfD subunit